MLLAAVLMALCIFQPSSVFASTGFDGACTSISLSTTNGSLLTTDQNGKVFSGTLTEPLQGTLATAGDVKQARYVLGNSRILLVYQSGAIEILDPAYPVVALARLPASTYVDVKVSRDGRWAVGLLPGRASVEVLELSPNAFRPIRRYDHPIGGTFTVITIATELPIVAMLDEKYVVHLFDWKQGQRLPTPRDLVDPKLRNLTFITDDLLWATVNAGLMPIGSAVDLTGKGRTVQGTSITRSAQFIELAQGQVVLGSDDLGFTDILRRTAHGAKSTYVNQGNVILAPQLREAVADPARDLVALCGASLEVVSLSSGARLLRMHSPLTAGVFVDNVTRGGEFALVRDMDGRGAIWSVPNLRYVSMLPRVQLQVFPAMAAVDAGTKSYLSFGQANVLTVSRPIKIDGATGASAYAVSAVPVPFDKQRGEVWESTAIFAPDDGLSAYVLRPELIGKVSWSSLPVNDSLALLAFIRAPSSSTQCPVFSGGLVASESGHLLAVGCVDGIAVYDTKTRRRVAFIKSPEWADVSARFKVWVSSLAFSSDGNSLVFSVRVQRIYVNAEVDSALSANAPTVYVFDLRTATLKPIKTAGQVPVTAVAFSPDGRQVWVGGRWGDLAVYSAAQGVLLWRQKGVVGTIFGIAFDEHGDAAVWTDAGLIAHVRQRDRSASRTWFMAGGRTGGDGVRQPADAESALELAVPLPIGFLSNPRQNPTVEITLKVPSLFEAPLQSLLYVDEKAVAIGSLVGPVKNGLMRLSFSTQSIAQGNLSVGLFAPHGGASIPLLLGNVTVKSGFAGTGKLVGAFVGISKYDDPGLPELPFAEGDAGALASALQQEGAQLHVFPPEQKRTKEKVMRFLGSIVDTVRTEDTLVLFLSGHGYTLENRFVLPTSDTRQSESSGSGSGISAGELLELVSAGRQGDTFLILDTCESGAFIADVLRHPLLSDGPLSLGSSGRGAANNISVLAAAAPLRVAKEGYAGRGLLTGVILDGLKGPADLDRNGKITQTELMSYVDLSMVTISRRAFATAPQDPVLHYGTTAVEVLRVRGR